GAIILNFWSAECPWSAGADQELLSYLPGWGGGVSLWSIASNANEPVELLARTAAERSLPVVLLDSHQVVADLYGAKTTPHFFIVDERGILRYQGAINDVTFRQPTPTRDYLREAVDAILSGHLPDPSQISPYGCAIVRFAN
ncbi:hypothetical protein ACFLV7_16315, partial [Chloroflexota bacterium]